jgi:hypothetical protein
MKIDLPPKKYFSTYDLRDGGLDLSLLRHLFLIGEIVPSIFMTIAEGGYDRCQLFELYDESLNKTQLAVDDCCFDGVDALEGFYYLIFPLQLAADDGRFRTLSDKARNHKSGDSCYQLGESVSLDFLFDNCVVMREEVERYLSTHSDSKSPATSLGNRERDTLLSIIAALCKEAKLDYAKPAKTAGLIQSTAAQMGIQIGETTIENHLKKIPNALASRAR